MCSALNIYGGLRVDKALAELSLGVGLDELLSTAQRNGLNVSEIEDCVRIALAGLEPEEDEE